MSERSQRALQAALRAAGDLGLPSAHAEVLRDRYNLLVHLPRPGVVIRVATATAEVRGPDWLEREVAVAEALRDAGAPVVPPTRRCEPGPHSVDGFTLTVWDYVEVLPGVEPDPAEAGHRLRACHDVLDGFSPPAPRFPVLVEARDLVHRLDRAARALPEGAEPPQPPLADHDLEHFDAVADRLTAQVRALVVPFQQVHGDAHLGNVLPTAAGPLWGDWEDTIAAPREWDLACALAGGAPPLGLGDGAAGRAMVDAYGFHDESVLALMLDVRRLQSVAWALAVPPQSPDDPRPAWRLAWLRDQPA